MLPLLWGINIIIPLHMFIPCCHIFEVQRNRHIVSPPFIFTVPAGCARAPGSSAASSRQPVLLLMLEVPTSRRLISSHPSLHPSSFLFPRLLLLLLLLHVFSSLARGGAVTRSLSTRRTDTCGGIRCVKCPLSSAGSIRCSRHNNDERNLPVLSDRYPVWKSSFKTRQTKRHSSLTAGFMPSGWHRLKCRRGIAFGALEIQSSSWWSLSSASTTLLHSSTCSATYGATIWRVLIKCTRRRRKDRHSRQSSRVTLNFLLLYCI